MADAIELEWQLGDHQVAWHHGDDVIVKRYNGEVGSAVALRDGSGVAVVEPSTPDGRNAVVFNLDGSERFRVQPPRSERHVSFQQIFYIGSELTAIAITRGNDWAAVVGESTGELVRVYETR